MSRDGVSLRSFLVAAATIAVASTGTGLSSPAKMESSGGPQVQTRKPQTVRQKQVKVAPSTRLQATIAKTRLEVSRTGASEFPDWASSAIINGPTFLKFRWTTDEEDVSAGIWRVTPEPYTPGGNSKVYASGELPKPPGPGKIQGFSIDLREFTPAVAPKAPYFLKYYVSVSPVDATTGDERAPSGMVAVTYREPGPDTIFTEDMESDPAAEAIVLDVYKKLKETFGMTKPLGPVITGTKTLAGWGMFESPNGPVSIEVHVTEATDPPVIYVAVPQAGTGDLKDFDGFWLTATYHWFQYTYDATGLVPVLGDQYPPPGSNPPVMSATRDWCHDDTYDLEAVELDDDPPHWSPFLIKDASYASNGRISDIHKYFQRAEDQDMAKDRLTRHRNAVLAWDPEELGERSLNSWPGVTVRGLVTGADFPGGDFGGDHTTGYIPSGEDEAPSGGLWEESDPDVFPGMDWDVRIQPDPAYRYLASVTRGTLQVEIEHFALPNDWRPRKGEWLQAEGRWVVDCGHRDDDTDDYYTEIHPPELLVTTEVLNAFGSRARVAVTGAWLGGRKTFVVNPPARPSPTSVLKYALDTTWAKAAKLSLEAVPPDDPNHLIATVRKTDGHQPLMLHSDGRISMRRQGYRGFVRVWWDESLATVEGTVTAENQPALGAFVFHRDATIANAAWRRTRVDGGGYYRIPGLAKGGSYLFVVGGSGWDFDKTPSTIVVDQDTKVVNFSGHRAVVQERVSSELVSDSKRVAVFRPQQSEPSLGEAPASSIQPITEITQIRGPQKIQTYGMIRSMIFSVKEPGYSFGVLWNHLGYPEQGVVSLHLQGLSDWEGKPVADFSSAYSVDEQGAETEITIEGYPTPGVANARVKASILLGNDAVGYRVADVAEGKTNRNGVVVFRFKAGVHVEESVVELEVLENPYNPWFKPAVRGNTRLFHPRGGDASATGSRQMVAAQSTATQLQTTTYNIEALVDEDDLVFKAAVAGFGERNEFAEISAEKKGAATAQQTRRYLTAVSTDATRGVSKRVVREE